MSWMVRAQRVSVRLSKVDGWREAGSSGLESLWRISVRMVTVDPQFDPECYHNDECPSPLITEAGTQQLSARSSLVSNESLARTGNPFDDSFTMRPDKDGGNRDPFDDSNEVTQEDKLVQRPESQQPYHVFPESKKRLLVAIIGLAGLFSGLSSNIYFPAQDLIARAS